MVTPGTDLSTQNATVEVHRNGTSGAAALASGLAVNVLEAYPELQNSPAALKVLLMAASSHVSSSSASPPHVMAAKQGAGLPHFGLLKNLNAIGVVAEEPSNHPNPNDIIPQPLGLTLSAGTWRIGFAWLDRVQLKLSLRDAGFEAARGVARPRNSLAIPSGSRLATDSESCVSQAQFKLNAV